MSVAHQANLNVPNAIDAENNKTMIGPFQKLKGAAFDRRYTREMIGRTHQSDRRLQEGSGGRPESGSEVLCGAGFARPAKAS